MHSSPLSTPLVVISIPLIVCLVGFPQLSETIYSPALPELAANLNIGAFWAELTLSIYFCGFAAGVFFWGLFCDLVGRRSALLAGILLYLLGSFLCLQAEGALSLLIGRFFQALGASSGSIVTQTMMRDIYSGESAGKIFSTIGAILQFSPALGPLIGGYLAHWYGWRSTFAFLIFFGLFIWIWSYLKLPETQLKRKLSANSFKETIRQLMRDSHIWNSALLIGVTNGIIFSYYAEAPFVLIETLGLSSALFGWVGIVIASAGVFASMGIHRLSGIVQTEKLMRIGALILTSGSLVLMIVTKASSIWALSGPLLPILLIGFWFVFAGIGFLLPHVLSQACVNYRSSMGTAGAWLGLIYYSIVALLTGGMSLWHDGSVSAIGSYFLLLSLIAMAATWKWSTPQQRNN